MNSKDDNNDSRTPSGSGSVSFISPFPDEVVLGVVRAAGWWRSDERLLWLCAATGHEFTVWYQTRRCGCSRGPGGHPGGAGGCGLEFRYCTGCGRDESRYAPRDTGGAARVAAIPVVCQLGAGGRGENAGPRRGAAVAVVDPGAVAG